MSYILVLRRAILLAILSCALLALPQAAAQTYPVPVVGSSSSTFAPALTTALGSSNPVILPQSIATDSAGNVYLANGAGELRYFSADGSTSKILLGNLSYPEGVAVDSLGNAYVTDFNSYVWKVTPSGATSVVYPNGTADTCAAQVTAFYGYFGPVSLATDSANNLYIGAYGGQLFKLAQDGTCTALATSDLGTNAVIHVASNAAGDLVYVTNASTTSYQLYQLKVGATSSVALGSPFSPVNGLRFDTHGNLFITDANSLDEIPSVNGSLSALNLTYLAPLTNVGDMGIDGAGRLYTGDDVANAIVRTSLGSVALPASAVNTPGTASKVSFVFNQAATLGTSKALSAYAVNTEFADNGTGTCTASATFPVSTSSAVSSCVVNLALTASAVGERRATYVLRNSANAAIATVVASGTGIGANIAVDPGTSTMLATGSTFTTPSAIAVDSLGHAFVADSGTGTVTEISGSAVTSVASGLNTPKAVAIDSYGDLFIADTENNRIAEVPSSGTALNSPSSLATVLSGLNAPAGVAVDLAGNLIIANTGAGTVLRVPIVNGVIYASLTSTLATLPGTSPAPISPVVDATGNIYVVGKAAGVVWEISTAGVVSSALSGLVAPTGIAIDPAGTLFVASAAGIARYPFGSTGYNLGTNSAAGAGLAGPAGIALDSLGDLYVADATTAVLIQRTTGALNFGNAAKNVATSASLLNVSNSGNQTLTFQSPALAVTGTAAADYGVTGSSGCTNGGTVTSGSSCTLSVVFTPSANGTRNATLGLLSNAVGATSYGASLTGAGTSLAATTSTLALTSPLGTISVGDSVVVQATVSSTSGTPSGTATFFVGGSTGSGTQYGSPVNLVSGKASQTITGLTAGTHNITVSYSGDTNFAQSNDSSSPLSIVVNGISTTTVLTSSASGGQAGTGTTLTFYATTASAKSSVTATPTGAVSFTIVYTDTSSPANVTTITPPAASLINGVASYSINNIGAGQYVATAVYNGDSTFVASTAASSTVAVGTQTIGITPSQTMLTVSPHGSSSFAFTLTPAYGFQGTVTFTCLNLPADSQCTFTPAPVTITSATPQTITLTVTTAVPFGAAVLSSSTIFLLFARRRKDLWAKRGVWLGCAVIALVLMACMSGCTAQPKGGGPGANSAPNTPTGSSTVIVLATATPNGGSALQQQFTFNLTVQ